MAKAKQEPLLDETDTQKNSCPWCNYENKDEEKGPIHTKAKSDYVVRNVGQAWQCDSCGKTWPKVNLGKPWTLALERGPGWEKAMKIRGLQESS